MELWGVRFSFIRGKGAAWRRGTGCMFAVTALALSGCSDQPAPSPTQTVQQTTAQPAATNTPMFASDEEALAAGVDLYQRYMGAQQEYINNPQASSSELESVSSGELLDQTIKTSQALRDNKTKADGSIVVEPVRMQQITNRKDDFSMTFYACVDYTNARLTQPDGSQKKLAGESDRVLMVVDASLKDQNLVLNNANKWSSDPC